ncbi:tumor protein p63-regulated gene 1 protein-like isoform X2 [Cylas formicarius]|uniref:tumor protein p63-regulated gene 1 protein-like isoform X2 n=1 Tax=Cylas formicarius TaxID=197179 RepID=UPI002958C0E9|nr:tumor protein p63-regulated gene 1 protein-like isoform X2 [Cylas formicarius]
MMDVSLEEDMPAEFRGGTLRLNKTTDTSGQNLLNSNENEKSTNTQCNSGDKNSCYWGSLPIPLSALSNKITETLWVSPKPKAVTPVQETPHQSLQPRVNINQDANNFFTYRDGVAERAAQECVEEFLDLETEGPLIATFLLTQINHWDTDKERLILLTSKILLVVKYDFIALKRLNYKKLPLEDIEAIIIGDLIYPNGSLIPNRNMKGIRILFGKGKPVHFASKWNPFKEDIPIWTFTFHPLYFHKDCTDENLRKLYDSEFFTDELCRTMIILNKTNENRILHSNILLESYVGLGAIIHNRNDLGFFKVRGKFSF